MSPSNVQSPAPTSRVGSGAETTSKTGSREDKPDGHAHQAQCAPALDELIADLKGMADWRDQLRVEIRRAELLFDLGLLTETHVDGLTRRVGVWCDAAKALAEKMPGRLVDHEVMDVAIHDQPRQPEASAREAARRATQW